MLNKSIFLCLRVLSHTVQSNDSPAFALPSKSKLCTSFKL